MFWVGEEVFMCWVWGVMFGVWWSDVGLMCGV